MDDHKFEPAGADAIKAAAKAANYQGNIPSDWLTFKRGEVVRIKGWLFKIIRATRSGRLVLETLPAHEVETLAVEAIRRIQRKQLVNSAEQMEKLKLNELAGVANLPEEPVATHEATHEEPVTDPAPTTATPTCGARDDMQEDHHGGTDDDI